MLDYKGLYSDAHDNPKELPGYTCRRYVPQIKALCERFKPQTMLDYACGKGYQYLKLRLHEQWGGPLPACYDIGVRQLAEKPAGQFDGVLNVDMLEHIATQDLEPIVRDIFGYARAFVFLGISCRPSKKSFPNGLNYHLTIQPPEWWEEFLKQYIPAGLHVERAYETDKKIVFFGP